MQKIIPIILIILFCQNITFAKNCCPETNMYKLAIINNVLNLTDEQIELQTLDCKAFRKCLTSDQRIKYDMIQKLEKDSIKKSKKKKDYYKSNPQMPPFGNPPICPKSKK